MSCASRILSSRNGATAGSIQTCAPASSTASSAGSGPSTSVSCSGVPSGVVSPAVMRTPPSSSSTGAASTSLRTASAATGVTVSTGACLLESLDAFVMATRVRRGETAGGRVKRPSQPQLVRVGVAVVAAGLLHPVDVCPGLGERDVVDRELLRALGRPDQPAVHVALAAVVGGQGKRLVAAIAVEQVAQVVRPVLDVDLRVGEVALAEPRAARPPGDEARRSGRDLHQPLGAGRRAPGAELRLGVDDAGDEGRI